MTPATRRLILTTAGAAWTAGDERRAAALFAALAVQDHLVSAAPVGGVQ